MDNLPEFQTLDPRVKSLWRMSNAIGFGILTLLSGVGAFFATRAQVPILPILAWSAVALWVLWGAFALLYYVRLSFEKAGWALDESVLWIRRGVWWQVTQLLPLSRLQHIDLKRGPWERKLGLATLTLHTAGTHAATLTLSGLSVEDAERLRDRLVAVGGDDGV
jgi:uncharacterized protein